MESLCESQNESSSLVSFIYSNNHKCNSITDTSSSEKGGRGGAGEGEGVQCGVFSGNAHSRRIRNGAFFPSPTFAVCGAEKKPPGEEMHANRNAAPKPKENHFSPLHPTYSRRPSPPRFTSPTATGRPLTFCRSTAIPANAKSP